MWVPYKRRNSPGGGTGRLVGTPSDYDQPSSRCRVISDGSLWEKSKGRRLSAKKGRLSSDRLMCLLVKDLRGCKAWVPAGGAISVARYGNPEKKKTPVPYNVQELIHQA